MTITNTSEIPEALNNKLQLFLSENSSWDNDRLVTNAIALFLSIQDASSKGRVVADAPSAPRGSCMKGWL